MKKIILIIILVLAIFQMVVLAIDIDIGSPAINRGDNISSRTLVVKENPANATGKITSIEIWAVQELQGCEVATFYVVSGNNLSTRDYETIQISGQDPGVVPGGSKQTTTVNLNVNEGDYIGIFYIGYMEYDVIAGNEMWYTGINVDNIPCNNVTFSLDNESLISLYGTGTTEEEANAIFFGMNF